MNRKGRIICLSLITILLLSIILVVAVSCDSDEEYIYAAVTGYVYNKDEKEVVAIVRLTNDPSNEIKTEAKGEAISNSNGVFYNIAYTTYTFDGSYFYSHQSEIFTPEVLNHDEIIYENLKLKFEYATIYKSTQSDGVRTVVGDHYVHTYDLVNGEMAIHLSRKYQNAGAWYSVLIASAIVCLVIAVAIALAVKNKGNEVSYAKEEREEE